MSRRFFDNHRPFTMAQALVPAASTLVSTLGWRRRSAGVVNPGLRHYTSPVRNRNWRGGSTMRAGTGQAATSSGLHFSNILINHHLSS
jgi:hypothetical protein